jgi:hypothetical protein
MKRMRILCIKESGSAKAGFEARLYWKKVFNLIKQKLFSTNQAVTYLLPPGYKCILRDYGSYKYYV